jgi:hypothetical protein
MLRLHSIRHIDTLHNDKITLRRVPKKHWYLLALNESFLPNVAECCGADLIQWSKYLIAYVISVFCAI